MPTLKEAFQLAERTAIADRLRPNTLRMLREATRSFIACYGPDAALPLDLTRFKAANTHKAATTVNKDLRILRRVYRLSGLSDRVETLRVARKRPDTLSQDELTRLLAASGRFSTLILFAIDTGCRRSEIASLKWEDVDLTRRRCTIADAKDGSQRVIPLSKRLVDALKLLPQGTWVFRRLPRKDQPWNSNSLSNAIADVFKRAGLKRLRRGLHSLRRSFCTRAARSGVAIKTTMAITGHRQISTLLNFYVDVSEEETEAAVDKLAGE